MSRVKVGGQKLRNNHFVTFNALKAYRRQKGHMPVIAELAQIIGASTSTVWRHLLVLAAQGYIERLGGYRGIKLTGLEPQAAETAEELALASFRPSCLFRSKSKVKAAQRTRTEKSMPKLTRAQLDARIEMVVRKAKTKEAFRQDHDVIHDYRSRFSGNTLKAHKL